MANFLKNILGAKSILFISLFNVVASKSTGTVGAAAPATFESYWEFQDPNAWLITELLSLRCRICLFLYNSSNPAMCVEPCSAPASAAASALPDCNTAKSEAASYIELNGRLYTYHSKKLSWDNAKAKCIELGMHLLIVDTASELSDVLSSFAPMATADTWVGLKLASQNPDTYAWVDDTSISVGFSPSNGKECGVYDGSTLTTMLCNPTNAFVCEREVPC